MGLEVDSDLLPLMAGCSAGSAAQISVALDKNMPFMCHMQEAKAARQEAFANHQA
jgi:hypothetical protein